MAAASLMWPSSDLHGSVVSGVDVDVRCSFGRIDLTGFASGVQPICGWRRMQMDLRVQIDEPQVMPFARQPATWSADSRICFGGNQFPARMRIMDSARYKSPADLFPTIGGCGFRDFNQLREILKGP